MHITEGATIKPLTVENYLSVIRGSVGTSMFRHMWLEVGGEKIDAASDGDKSCAFFVSAILSLFGLIDRVHATVSGTIKDMEQSDWQIIGEPRVGAVILWADKLGHDGQLHKHLGFYVEQDQAISNSSEAHTPQAHHWTYGTDESGQPKRAIEAIYWHDKLNDPYFALK